MHLAGVKGIADLSARDAQGQTSTSSMIRAPADVQANNSGVNVANLTPPADGFIGDSIGDRHMQHLNGNNSVSHITSSQPNQGNVSSIVYDARFSSSQPGTGNILNSPRRTRSQGQTTGYTLSYRRPGFERS